jgi:hypothetical protein
MTIEIACPYCNFSKKVPKEKIPIGVNRAKCPQCAESFEFNPINNEFDFQEQQMWQEKEQESSKASPWENLSDLGVRQGIYQTFKSVLFSPKKFFEPMARVKGTKEPFAFGLLLGSIGTMFYFFWQFLLMPSRIPSIINPLLERFPMNSIFFGILLISPLLVILGMFIYGGVIHLCLLIVGGGGSGFNGTFRVIAYSQATGILSIIPFFGGIIGWFWNIIILIVGLRNIHKTSYPRVIIAILIPIGLIFFAGIIVALSIPMLF